MSEDEGSEGSEGVDALAIARRFIAGALVTAIFSGSLAMLARHAGWVEVLTVGMIVPSFTWVVQLTVSALLLPVDRLWRYWADLSYICLLGSFALLPAAFANFFIPRPALWWSVANVVASVALMAGVLFARSARHGIAVGWPVSWCLTITVNMALFCWASWNWW